MYVPMEAGLVSLRNSGPFLIAIGNKHNYVKIRQLLPGWPLRHIVACIVLFTLKPTARSQKNCFTRKGDGRNDNI